jgi:hypothetical protein
MKVGIFYNSITNPAKFSNKVMLMDNFRSGVLAHNDQVVEFHSNSLPDQDLDAGFVLGYTLEDNFRRKIINLLKSKNTPAVFVDSNILHYSRPEHEWHRYSIGSVYPNSGIYFFQDLDQDKWSQYSSWHNVELRPWRSSGDHILILCQRPKGFNMFIDQDNWLEQTVNRVRNLSDRPVVIRMHPGDGARFKQIDRIKKRWGESVAVDNYENIRESLTNCWCTVGINSTPNVVSTIEGLPGYIEDPAHSWAAGVAFTDLADIVNPPLSDRSQWIHRIANIHWSNSEVKSGQLWAAIKQYISAAR